MAWSEAFEVGRCADYSEKYALLVNLCELLANTTYSLYNGLVSLGCNSTALVYCHRTIILGLLRVVE